MTGSAFLEKYLFESPADDDEWAQVGRGLIGPGQPQPVFDLVATLVARRDVSSLRLLYAGGSPLHDIIADDNDFRRDEGFAERAGYPFRPAENAAGHATRALAGLGLALTAAEPAGEPWRAALAWYTEARGWANSESRNPAHAAGKQPSLADLPIGAADCRSGAMLTAALTMQELAAATDKRRSRTGVKVLLVRGGEGVSGNLRMSVVKGLPPALVPDPERMSLFAADPSFQRSLERAWFQAGGRQAGGAVLWSIEEKEGPSRQLTGESAGAALAAALDEVGRLSGHLAGARRIWRLQSANAIIGRIDDIGYLQGVEGYEGKLAALGPGSRVIVPAVDTEKAVKAAMETMEIVPATRWPEAARKARSPNRKVVLGQALTLFVVLAVVAGLFAWRQHSNAGAQGRAAAQQRDARIAVELANESEAAGDTDPRTSQLESIAAWAVDSAPSQVRYALVRAAASAEIATLPPGSGYGSVNQLAFSPRSKILAVVYDNGTLEVWNMASGQKFQTKDTGTGGVGCLAFSPDGTTLALAGTDDGIVELWNVATRQHRSLDTNPALIDSLSFSPDGTTLAIGDGFGTAELWNIASGDKIQTLSAGAANITVSVAFSPTGNMLATGGSSGPAELWDLTNGRAGSQPSQTLNTGSAGARALAFSPGGTTLATGGSDSAKTELWSIAGGQAGSQPSQTLNTGSAGATSLAFGPGGTTLAVGSGDGTELWDPATGSQVGSLGAGLGATGSLAFASQGHMLATGGDDGTVRLWDATNGQLSSHSAGAPSQFGAVAFSSGGTALATGGKDGKVELWNTTTGQHSSLGTGPPAIDSLAFSPDGTMLAMAGTAGGTVGLWNLKTGRRSTLDTGSAGGVGPVAFDPHGTMLATAVTGAVQLWNLKTGQHSDLSIGSGTVGSVAFSPDATMLAAGVLGGTAYVWKAADGQQVRRIDTGSDYVLSLAFSPDSTELATGDVDGTAAVWTVANGQPFRSFDTGSGTVGSVAFTPDGTTLATGGGDGTAELWDVASGQPFRSFNTGSGTVDSVAFGPHGTTLVTGSGLGRIDYDANGAVKRWSTKFLTSALTQLCSQVGGSLTLPEWRQYVSAGPPYRDVCAQRS